MMSTPSPRDSRDDGMTLVEVLLAAVILGSLAAAVLGVLLQTQHANIDSRARTAAASLAAREIDFVREEFGRSPEAPLQLADAGVVTNPHPLPGQPAGQPLVVDGQRYTVTRSTAWNATGPGRSACEGGALVAHPTLTVTVSVTWPNMGSTRPVVSHVQLAPSKVTGTDRTSSYVAVSVVDSEGQPNPGRSVRVTRAVGVGETRSALTDASGCAVVAVTPAAAGNEYAATLMDSNHVDVNGAPNPSRHVGLVKPGDLSLVGPIAYDRAATLRLRVVDDTGAPVSDELLAGRAYEASVVATESTGATATTRHQITGNEVLVPGLWPTVYGAYFGTTAPVTGYPTRDLAPGAVGEIQVVLALAHLSVTDLPPGADSVTFVATGMACDDPAARPVPPGGVSLVPGMWDVYANGPGFVCAPGPRGESFTAGDNGALSFLPTTLHVPTAPADGLLRAVHHSRAVGLTTCPAPDVAVHAVSVDAARTGPLPLPAGDWFLYRTDAAGTCLGAPGLVALEYGTDNTRPWIEAARTVALTVRTSGTPALGESGRTGSKVSYQILLSSTPLRSCGAVRPAEAIPLITTSTTTAQGPVDVGTYYVYRYQDAGGSGSNRCTASVSTPYTITGSSPTASITFGTTGVQP